MGVRGRGRVDTQGVTGHNHTLHILVRAVILSTFRNTHMMSTDSLVFSEE